MKIAVTGANGYIGSHIVKYLLDNTENEVLAVDFHNNKIDSRAQFLNYDILGNSEYIYI